MAMVGNDNDGDDNDNGHSTVEYFAAAIISVHLTITNGHYPVLNETCNSPSNLFIYERGQITPFIALSQLSLNHEPRGIKRNSITYLF